MPIPTLVWAVATLIEVAASIVLFSKSRYFRVFWLFMCASAIRGVWSLGWDPAPYMIVLEAAAVLQIYWLLTEKFPRWRFGAGTVFLAGIAALGASGAWLLRGIGIPVEWSGTAYAIQRQWMIALVIIMLLMRWMVATFTSDLLPVRPITQRAADCLTISTLMGAVTAWLVMNAGHPPPLWARCAEPIAGCINGTLWAFWLPHASQECGEATGSNWRYLRIMARNRADMKHLARAVELITRPGFFR